MTIKSDTKPTSEAERHALRQQKIKAALVQSELLQSDIKTVVVILKSAIDALKMISMDNDDAKSISIVTHQIENAMHLLNHDPNKKDRRKCDPVKKS